MAEVLICPECGEAMKRLYEYIPRDTRSRFKTRRYECSECPTRVTTEEWITEVDKNGALPPGRPWRRKPGSI